MKEDKMGGTCSIHGQMKFVQNFSQKAWR